MQRFIKTIHAFVRSLIENQVSPLHFFKPREASAVTSRMKSVLHFSIAAVVLFSAITARAGITGSISGTVSDPSGAVMAGVTVSVTSVSTGVRSTTVTDGKGFYRFPALNVDTYDVAVTQTGFRPFLESGVRIDANSAIQIDIALQLGQLTDTVTVKSNTLQVETQSTQMGDVIEGTTITSVPLNGRSYIDLLALQPGVSPYTDDDTAAGLVQAPVSGSLGNGTQSINGGRPEANGFMVNGADAEEGVHNGAAIVPNLDAISEFRIITNNFNAEYGNYSGGQINVVTKSGSNDFHGGLFEFLRNTDFDAANYFTGRGDFKQNQFGGTFGGPIKKNKLFFFVDYQGTRQIIGAPQYYAVPSTADRTGNLSDQAASFASGLDNASPPHPITTTVDGTPFANVLGSRLGYTVNTGEPYYYTAGMVNPATIGSNGVGIPYTSNCTSNDPTTGCVFPNANIPQTAWDPVAVNMLKYIPSPNGGSGALSTFSTSAFNESLTDNKAGARVDASLGKNMLFGYYFIDKYNVANPYQSVNIPGFTAVTYGMSQMINLGMTTTVSPSTVNDARLVYLRNVNFIGNPQGGLGVSLASLGFNTPWNTTGGIGNISPSLAGVPNTNFNAYSFGVPSTTFDQHNNTFQIIDNLTRIVGTHTFQFGADVHYDQIDLTGFTAENGQFFFTGSETGLDFADFLIGAPSSFIQGSPDIEHTRSKYYGLYGQDSWRVRPTLTLNYGLRWEASTPWYDKQNYIETLIVGEQSQLFPDAPPGLVVPGDPGVPRTLAPTRYGNFAPRFGLAYSPKASEGLLARILGGPGNTSIRLGYGLFYQSIQQADTEQEIGDAPYGFYYQSSSLPLLNSPFINRTAPPPPPPLSNVVPSDFPFSFPPPNVSAKNPDIGFPWTLVEPIAGGNYFNPKNVLPYSQDYELSLQRQFGRATVLSLSYVGTVGHKLLTFVESNPGNEAVCLFLSNPANLALTTSGQPQTPCGPFGEDPGTSAPYQLATGVTVPGFSGATKFATTRLVTGFGTPSTDNFGSNAYMNSVANSSYNSFQDSLQHTDKYAEFMIGYTWAKSMDNGSGTLDATNPYNPRQSRALSIYDVPQIFVASYTIHLPLDRWSGDRAVSRGLTGGWALSGITTFASGRPVQLTENDDNSLSGTFLAPVDAPSYADNGSKLFVDKNPRNLAGPDETPLPYFNPAYFIQEPEGQIGNVMRRFFNGPGINNFDLALLKNTKITETKELQFRAEAFNVFNHAQFQIPTASGLFNNTGVDGFGYATVARDPRIMQLGLKLLF